MSDARVFDFGLKGEALLGGDVASGELGELWKAGWDGDKLDSEAVDCVLEVMGTVRVCRLALEPAGSFDFREASSAGISSAGGMGRPLAAATS